MDTKRTKILWILIFIIVLVTATVYFTVFYETEKMEWKKAVEQNTVEVYSHYIENYPEGSNIEQAKEKLMQLKTPEGMVYVKGGTFQMGCISEQGCDCQDDNKPLHSVTISSFYIGATEVTNAQYCEFLNAYGSDTVKSGEYLGQPMIVEWPWGVRKSDSNFWQPQAGYENHPVVPLSWLGAIEYCKWRSVRLPTEAEWEYAARGGQNGKSTYYAGSNNIDEVGWYKGNSSVANSTVPGGNGTRGTMPVKLKAPNELGIYDMSGNVWEFCADWYKADFYSQSDNTNNPLCDEGEKKLRVLRGGSWYNDSCECGLFNRGWREPSSYTSVFGLRVAASGL